MNILKKFWMEEDGMGTVEIILIIAVLVIIALLFRNKIMEWVESMIEKLFPDAEKTAPNENITPNTPKKSNTGP